MKGVKSYVKGGKAYAYHRKSGTRLESPYGSAAFYVELKAIEDKHSAKPKEPKPGTWGHLPTLKPRTREDYEGVLDWLKPLDAMPLENWTRGFVLKLRDKAFEQRKRRFANYMVAVVQGVFTWALDREHVEEHNIRKIKPIKRPRDMDRANRPWTRAEWDAVTAAAPPHLLAPILLCGVLGWREGEALTRPRTDYDPAEKKIKRVSLKSGKRVKTPVPKLISDALDALFPHQATTLLVNSRGQPWTADGFRASMWTLRKQLKAAGKIGDGLTVHGLRHTCGTLMKELGFDLDTIADMLGQEDAGMAAWYAREAETEKKLTKVVEAIDEQLSNKSVYPDG